MESLKASARLIMLAVILVCSPAMSEAADVDLISSYMSAKVLGQSGKVTLYKGSDTSRADRKAVEIDMDFIRELDANGAVIANLGANAKKHGTNSFANTAFTFSSVKNEQVLGLNATVIDFQVSMVAATATLKVKLVVFTERGVVTPTDTEAFPVAPGSSKFDIYVENWPFCDGGVSTGDQYDACVTGGTALTGAFLDLGVTVKGSLLGAQCTGHARCDAVTSLDTSTECLNEDIVQAYPGDCTGGAACDAVTGTALSTSVACDAASTASRCDGGLHCSGLNATSCAAVSPSCSGGAACASVSNLSNTVECHSQNKTDNVTQCEYTASCTFVTGITCSYASPIERVPCVYTPAGGSFDVGDLPSTIIVNGTNRSTGTALELQPGVATVLSNRVEVDHVWQQTPTGYPAVTACGDGCNDFTFRFPLASSFLHYDPIVLTDDPMDSNHSTPDQTSGGSTPDQTSGVGSLSAIGSALTLLAWTVAAVIR